MAAIVDPPDPLVAVLGEIRDVLREIRDQRTPPEAAQPVAAPGGRPGKSDRATLREHIIG
jgi:hypothetical protein